MDFFPSQIHPPTLGEDSPRIYVIPADPITYNNAYPTRFYMKGNRPFGYRFLAPEAEELKNYVKQCMYWIDQIVYKDKFIAPYIDLDLWYLFPPGSITYKYDKDQLKKVDVSGFVKLIEDAISDYIEIDDKVNIDVHAHKREIDVDFGVPVIYAFLRSKSSFRTDFLEWQSSLIPTLP